MVRILAPSARILAKLHHAASIGISVKPDILIPAPECLPPIHTILMPLFDQG